MTGPVYSPEHPACPTAMHCYSHPHLAPGKAAGSHSPLPAVLQCVPLENSSGFTTPDPLRFRLLESALPSRVLGAEGFPGVWDFQCLSQHSLWHTRMVNEATLGIWDRALGSLGFVG